MKTEQLISSINETLYMSVIATGFIFLLGLLLGIFLYLTFEGNLIENKKVYSSLSWIVDLLRSIPFVILLILLIPITKFLMGTMLGVNAALPPLIIGGTPFYARVVELALREVDKGTIEAARCFGANTFQIITKVLVPEALPAIVSGLALTSISIVSYSAMAGIIGAGGLGNYAYLYGFQRNNQLVVFSSTICILIIVLVIQSISNYYVKKIDHRK
jgi:D-methionine transport system permease protein